MKSTDTQLLEEAYSSIQTSVKVLKGPIRNTVITNDYYVNLGGTDYLYRTTENESGKMVKEELFIGFGGNKPKPTPGSNVAQSPSQQKSLKAIRNAVSQH